MDKLIYLQAALILFQGLQSQGAVAQAPASSEQKHGNAATAESYRRGSRSDMPESVPPPRAAQEVEQEAEPAAVSEGPAPRAQVTDQRVANQQEIGNSTRTCSAGQIDGVEPANAATATTLVCDALREQKRSGIRRSDNDDIYKVDLLPLGSHLVVRLRQLRGNQQVQSSAIKVITVEEIDFVAERLARSIVTGVPLSETQQTYNLSASETRRPNQLNSEFVWGLGLGGLYALGTDADPGYGAELIFQHQTGPVALTFTGRLYGGGSSLLSVNMGGRYFLSASNIAPFFGANLGLSTLEVDDAYGILRGGGFGGQLELGAEAMRFADSQLGAVVRLDVPFFSLDRMEADSQYILPVSFSVYYLF